MDALQLPLQALEVTRRSDRLRDAKNDKVAENSLAIGCGLGNNTQSFAGAA
jgi:hypothetical protein